MNAQDFFKDSKTSLLSYVERRKLLSQLFGQAISLSEIDRIGNEEESILSCLINGTLLSEGKQVGPSYSFIQDKIVDCYPLELWSHFYDQIGEELFRKNRIINGIGFLGYPRFTSVGRDHQAYFEASNLVRGPGVILPSWEGERVARVDKSKIEDMTRGMQLYLKSEIEQIDNISLGMSHYILEDSNLLSKGFSYVENDFT